MKKATHVFEWDMFSRYRAELMGVSIIGVLFCHWLTNAAEHGITEFSLAQNVLMQGSAFVDAFFFLSGIGLYYSFSKKRSLSRFYKKRYVRLLIPYFVVAIPTIIFCCVRDGTGMGAFILNITGVSFFTSGSTFAWFVIAIAIFYLAFPGIFAWLFSDQRKGKASYLRELIKALAICLVLVAIACILKLTAPGIFENVDIALQRMPIFVMGIYCGRLCYENAKIPNWLLRLFLIVGALTFVGKLVGWIPGFFTYYANTVQGVFFITVFAIILEMLKEYAVVDKVRSILRRLGGGTLELYLCHIATRQFFDCPYVFWKYLLLCVVVPLPVAFIVKAVADKIIHYALKEPK